MKPRTVFLILGILFVVWLAQAVPAASSLSFAILIISICSFVYFIKSLWTNTWK